MLFVKAEARDRERTKEESRRQRRLESGFRALLKTSNVTSETPWEEVRPAIAELSAFTAITIEADRIRIYKVDLFATELF